MDRIETFSRSQVNNEGKRGGEKIKESKYSYTAVKQQRADQNERRPANLMEDNRGRKVLRSVAGGRGGTRLIKISCRPNEGRAVVREKKSSRLGGQEEKGEHSSG